MACRSNWSCAFPLLPYNLISGIGAQRNGAIFCPRQPSRALAQTLLKTAFSKNKQAGNAHCMCREKAIASSSLFVHATTAFQLLIFNSPRARTPYSTYQHVALKPSSFSQTQQLMEMKLVYAHCSQGISVFSSFISNKIQIMRIY
jgi:hypothetical protein